MRRSLIIILDSVGCGHAPDAAHFGDEGANTLGHLYQNIPGFRLAHLESIGLGKTLNFPRPKPPRHGFSAHRLTSRAAGKDTTSGHWELMGHPLSKPFVTVCSFPKDLLSELTRRTGCEWIGNHPASGTDILQTLGQNHLETNRPILYTSADSVLQIAAHEETFGLDRLLSLCREARKLLDERNIRVGRVIARPFVGDPVQGFTRTPNRHDFSIRPQETVLNRLQTKGVWTMGIGKISDIFAGSGIQESFPTRSNEDGMTTIERLWDNASAAPRLLIANLVDFDALHGHRRDPPGYAACLAAFDQWLGGFLSKISPEDQFLITADHGNDPYYHGFDHTREQVPLLLHQPRKHPVATEFQDVAEILESYF